MKIIKTLVLTSLFAALNVATGEVIGRCHRRQHHGDDGPQVGACRCARGLCEGMGIDRALRRRRGGRGRARGAGRR